MHETLFDSNLQDFTLLLAIILVQPTWIVVTALLSMRRMARLATQVGGHARWFTITGERDGLRWTMTRTQTRRKRLIPFVGRDRYDPAFAIHVSTPIGWRAWRRGDFTKLDTWLGGASLGLGDPLFDDQVALDASPLQIACAFTEDVEQRVLAWVVAGKTVERDGLEHVIPDTGDTAPVVYLDELLELARLLTAPADLDVVCLARAASNEVGPSLRAAAVLGSSLPPVLTGPLCARARAQLSKGFLEEPALAVLVALEPPGDEITSAILPLLRSDRESVRLEAIRALRALGTASALPALRALPPGGPWSGQRDELDALVDHLSAGPAVPWTQQIK